MVRKKYELEILFPARNEIKEIASLHLELVGPTSARKITNKIKTSLEHLRLNPHKFVRKVLCIKGFSAFYGVVVMLNCKGLAMCYFFA